jgi:hypothetical protein
MCLFSIWDARAASTASLKPGWLGYKEILQKQLRFQWTYYFLGVQGWIGKILSAGFIPSKLAV